MNLPANLPSVPNARLPASYEGAKTALAQCEKLDECKEWGDRMAALASYAKQADDDSLLKMAQRIKARAIRRTGELLKQIEEKRGANQNIGGGTPTKVVTRTEAAREVGLSKDQQVQAIRVANVPAAEFEKAVESENPATVTELAEKGKKKRDPAPLPAGFPSPPTAQEKDAAGALFDMREFVADVCGLDPKAMARDLDLKVPGRREEAIGAALTALDWLSTYRNELEGRDA